MYVNLIALQDQSNDLIEAIKWLDTPEKRLSASLRIESLLLEALDEIKKQAAYDLVRDSAATDVAIEEGIDPRKLHRWANQYSQDKGLPRRRLRLHRFDPQEAVDLQAARNRPRLVDTSHPIASQESPWDPDAA